MGYVNHPAVDDGYATGPHHRFQPRDCTHETCVRRCCRCRRCPVRPVVAGSGHGPRQPRVLVLTNGVGLIDASGLSGLTRVFSFLALGLSLAALAWLNRWAAWRQGDDAEAA